jgi:hypothetical protein
MDKLADFFSALAGRLTSEDAVAVFLGAAGAAFLCIAIFGTLKPPMVTERTPRILSGVFACILMMPAFVIATSLKPNKFFTPAVASGSLEIHTKPLSRGIPFRIEDSWFVVGGTTVSANPRSGTFYVISSGQDSLASHDYKQGTPYPFIVDDQQYCFQANEVHDAWIRATILPNDDNCD